MTKKVTATKEPAATETGTVSKSEASKFVATARKQSPAKKAPRKMAAVADKADVIQLALPHLQ
ncbi:hypothetical protein OKW41_000373 [Paraburkholderia sp. UCT70]|uniref:hypothetical protein n=1 Tax=Paraburkholderia sp. UCT70 TaxID=2991068 RepID=UPI003D254982